MNNLLEISLQFSGQKSLTGDEWINFNLLYKRILSPEAINLYTLAITFNETQQLINYQLLADLLQVDSYSLLDYRIELEKWELFTTYELNNMQVIVIEAPKYLSQLVSHPTLRRYYNQLVKSEAFIKQIKNYLPTLVDVSDAINISKRITAEDLYETTYDIKEDAKLLDNFNLNMLLASLKPPLFPDHLKTEQLKQLIYKYRHFPLVQIRSNLLDAVLMNPASGIDGAKFDYAKFEKMMTDHIAVGSDNPKGDSLLYLASKNKNQTVLSPSDKALIEELRTQYNLADEVINALIDYALNVSNQRLVRRFVTKLASSLNRTKINNYHDATLYLNNQLDMNKKTKPKKIEKPINYQGNVTPLSQDQLEQLITDLRKGNNHES